MSKGTRIFMDKKYKKVKLAQIERRCPDWLLEVALLVETAPRDMTVTTDDVARAFDISNNNAAQRAFWAIHSGYIDRNRRGHYRSI
jgi:predicted transcriptional regulator of viral defense system